MGWQIINGIPYRQGVGSSWSSYWKSQDEVLFFAETKDIADGKLYNKVTGATDYLTVGGSAGSYTFQCPNTAPYIAADTDYIWFKSDESQRTTTEAELIGYDFPRTPVKYNDDAPYAIVAIMILKSGATITGTKLNKLFQDMWLHTLWDNNLNAYGHIKGNKLAQTLWTPESVYDAASVALFARMDAVGETQTDARKTAIDTAIVALKTANLFDTRFDAMWVTRGSGESSTKMNWIKDTHNLTKVGAGTLTYTENVGYDGDGSCALTTNYKPSAQAFLYTQNSASFIIKISGTAEAAAGYGALNNPRLLFLSTNNRINCDTSGGTVKEVGYNGLARNSATEFKQYKNAATADIAGNSTGLPVDTVALMAVYNEGAASYLYNATTEVLEFAALGAYISQAEFLTIQGIINAYIASL